MPTDTSGSKFTVVAPQTIKEANIVSHNILENDAPIWSPGTYAAEDNVIYFNRVYEALVSTSDIPSVGAIADPPTWLDLGPTNRFRMFDGLPAPQSVRADIIDFTVNTGTIVNAVGLINVRGSSVTVQVITDAEGVVYTKTVDLQDTSLIFEDITFINDVVFLDLPNVAGEVRVIINASGATAALGEIVLGRQQVFGLTLFGTTVGVRDYSRIELNNFGDYDITRRRYSKTAEYDVKIEPGATASIQRALGRIRAKATLFIGSTNLEETIIYGLAQDADIIISSPAWNDLSISVVSLPYEELEDVFTGGSVNTPNVVNPSFGTIHPSNAAFRTTDFVTSPVGQDTHESTTWQFSETSDFAVIFFQSALDSVNLTEYETPSSTFTLANDYWIRVLHTGTAFGDSAWSAAVKFTASEAVTIATPSITTPTEAGRLVPGSSIESSAFSSDAAASGTHFATRWVISTNSGMTSPVYDEVDTVNLVSLVAPAELNTETTYYATVQYQDIYGIWSSVSAVRQFDFGFPIGQQEFTTAGTTNWTVPANVFSVSAVAVGSGGGDGGGGGALAYSSGFSVTPGETLSVTVGASVNSSSAVNGNVSQILRGATGLIVANGGRRTDDNRSSSSGTERTGGGQGGRRGVLSSLSPSLQRGGGGAGGYSGDGGDAGRGTTTASGSNGAGGGGGGGYSGNGATTPTDSGPGGGVGIYGEGSNGTGGVNGAPKGTSGSGGTNQASANLGGLYGGGGRGSLGASGQGAVRIIWGTGRAYPSTRTADE